MAIILIKIFILNIILFNVLAKSKRDEKPNIYDYNKIYSDEFKSSVIKYLKDNSLYENESTLVSKKTFRKIFKDIMNSGNSQVFKVFEIFKEFYDKVCDDLIKDAYPKGVKKIKANLLKKYFDYDYVMEVFNKHVSKNEDL